MKFLNIFLIFSLVQGKSKINDILVTNLKKDEVIKLFTKPVIFNKYLEMVEATDIALDPEFKTGMDIKFPQKITYNNYPKVNFFPYKLPKTSIVQRWDIDKYNFVGNIKCIHIELDINISIEGDSNAKIIFYSEIKSKKFYVPEKILDMVISDLKGIIMRLI